MMQVGPFGDQQPLPLLFQPLTIRGTTLANRIVLAPMVHYRARDGMCGTFHAAHLGKFILGGFGLVFTEAVAIERRGMITDMDLGIYSDAQADAFRPLITLAREEGVKIGIQLAHGGRKAGMQSAMEGNGALTDADVARGRTRFQPVGPTTGRIGAEWPVPHHLSASEITALVETFAAAARRAAKVGFDVIEVHGAHGYLLASFLSPVSNTRNDAYGGDIRGRMRFPLDVAEAVRAAIPDGMPLFFRVSSVDGTAEGWGMDDTVVLARELKSRGVDVLDCSSGGLTGSATAAPVTRAPGFQVPYAARAKSEAGISTMAVGMILEAAQAEAILVEGKADLIAVGRQAQFNPNIAYHWSHDLGLNQRFEGWPEEYGWWLDKRVRSMQGFATPTGRLIKA
jgi:2,4-dienoyl-CoA reductase-like NADH-dependent reductase (Old Yellow Enzyme family)